LAQDKLSRGQHIPCRAANQVPNRIVPDPFIFSSKQPCLNSALKISPFTQNSKSLTS
jgi:hypothetical protein